jgi:DMSO/TMAO reductase YedYZ molybdopterin-dependent catalytic subunit
LIVAVALLSGVLWSNGADLYLAGSNLLNWHIFFGVLLTLVVLAHTRLRAKPLRRADLRGRRQILRLTAIAAGSGVVWWLQRPATALAGWRGATRRWTGSYEQGSFRGNMFPTSSWVADQPRAIDTQAYRLVVDGLVARPLALRLEDLEPSTTHTATLDCTGGFFSTQHWRGVPLENLLARSEPLPAATHVRVVSVTGYRWDFPLDEAARFLLASHVGDEPLSHAHGSPVRLVAPGRRGFQWIKWVTRLELHAGLDLGAAASTIWSSLTPEGRGEA